MANFHTITCCCSNGLGSSLMVCMNVRAVLSELGITGIQVQHVPLSEAMAHPKELYVVGLDIAPQMRRFPAVVVLRDLISRDELRRKLNQAFESKEEAFRIE